ncbi:MAG: HAD family hydrolase [Phycisphaerae bacterium]|nr:HAD family hydrolase [Phycisphaerae bacterium]
MEIKAILFDIGDTLINYGQANVNALFRQGGRLTYEYLCDQFGREKMPSFHWYNFRHLLSIRYHYVLSMITKIEFHTEELLARRGRYMGLDLSQEQLEHLCHLWYYPLGKAAYVEPDIVETFEALKQMNLKLCVISNTFVPGYVLDSHLEQIGIRQYFDYWVYSCDTRYRKPRREIYQAALDKLQIDPGQIIMVGDRYKEDVKGPGKLGILGIIKKGVTNNKRKYPEGTVTIEHISDLPGLIKDWQKIKKRPELRTQA